MESNIDHTLDRGERVSSTYAEIYLNDDYCDYTKPLPTKLSDAKEIENLRKKPSIKHDANDLWVSPSDLLIGILELTPPFTSKITRGKTHEGILDIGDKILEKEHAKFMRELTTLLHENDSAWSHILEHERASVKGKVKEIYDKIFMDKSKIMKQEINAFYETTLQELETTLKTQVDNILISAHANIVSDLNSEIKQKLKKERLVVEEVLQKRYESEVVKIKHYYMLLLRNEVNKNAQLVNQAINERNHAFKAFYRQIEAENITSTMYVLCMERKKCRIRQFILENYMNLELSEKYQKVKERQNIINAYQSRDVHVSDVNKAWEEKIQKVLQIFLKFISFSLKLLPEQSSFMLDFEKMVVLQLNEIIKAPSKTPSIIVDAAKFQNMFDFEKLEKKESECTKEPFVIIGDLSDPIPTRYGSRETLPSNVDLPVVRLQRQFVYAKCHGYEQIKTLLEAQRCECSDFPSRKQPQVVPSVSSRSDSIDKAVLPSEKELSNELLLIDNFNLLHECPVRGCKDWGKRLTFPVLASYLDFNEENYTRVKAILGKPPTRQPRPILLDPKDIVFKELPFSATKEPFHTVETQYSSQADLNLPNIECQCTDDGTSVKHVKSTHVIEESPTMALNAILTKRKTSLRRIIQENPNLLKMFTDESFDFIL